MAAMPAAANPDDERRLREYATALADAVEAALPRWVERCVLTRFASGTVPAPVADAARDAGRRARDEIGPQVRALLALDIDEQRVNPLTLIRRAVRYPTEVLRAAGVEAVPRDEFAERAFPDDVYDLSPASFRDVDESLHEPGIVWGAAKAHVHLARHR